MMDKCPECGTELVHASAIAIYCPNQDCPVIDDYKLWDGNGNKAKNKFNPDKIQVGDPSICISKLEALVDEWRDLGFGAPCHQDFLSCADQLEGLINDRR